MVTMREISDLLKKIGKPGTKQTEKREAVEKLFTERGANITNSQGISVLDDLAAYPEF